MATEFDFDYQGNPMKHPFVKERMSDFNKQQADALMKANSGVYKNVPFINSAVRKKRSI